MIAAGFASATTTATGAVWPLFVFGCVAMLPIFHALVVPWLALAKAKGPKTGALFQTLIVLLLITWTAYPIIFATGEAGRVASVDAETIAYAVFDITAKCVFGAILMHGHADVDAEADAAEAAPKLTAAAV